jgi:Putative metal-binding motif
MKTSRIVSVFFALVAAAACSSNPQGGGFGNPESSSGSGSSGSSSSSGGSTGSSSGSSSGSVGSFGDDGGPVSTGNGCQYQDSTDHDGDGFSFTDGDCNDCDPNSNPGAFDVPKDGIDEDCDGIIDDEPTGCDKNAVLDSTDPFNAALAIDLCRKTTETATGKQRMWGVVDATFVAPDGSDNCSTGSCVGNANFPLGHGNLTKLGVNAPQNGGTHMLALSSGTARDPTDPGYENVAGSGQGNCAGVGGFDKGFTLGAATGFPTPAPACPNVTAGQPHDGTALRLVIRVPTNAQSFTFNENFFTPEFPVYICSPYNDSFVVEMAPAPTGAGTGGNVAFDQSGNPISVNNALLQVCTPQTAGGKAFACPLGASSLGSTGFDGHAATGWLQTQVGIDPSLKGKDVTILFAVWDSGDGCLDSTALIDNIQWSTQPGQNTPVTQPNPAQ